MNKQTTTQQRQQYYYKLVQAVVVHYTILCYVCCCHDQHNVFPRTLQFRTDMKWCKPRPQATPKFSVLHLCVQTLKLQYTPRTFKTQTDVKWGFITL